MKFFFNLCVMLFFFQVSTYAEQSSQETFSEFFQTYSFVKAQTKSLELITEIYPDFKVKADQAQGEWISAWGDVEKKLEDKFEELAKDDEKVRKLLSDAQQMMSTFGQDENFRDTLTEARALLFIEEVRLRAKGNLPSFVSSTLISAKKADDPAEEMLSGQKSVYESKDNKKTGEVFFRIEYPASWVEKEGIRPHVVKKFVSNSFWVNANVGVSVIDIFENLDPVARSRAVKELIDAQSENQGKEKLFLQMADSFKEETLGFLKNPVNIEEKKIILDQWPGICISAVGEVQRVDKKMTCFMIVHHAIVKNYYVSITSMMIQNPNEDVAVFEKRKENFARLASVVANSFVVMNNMDLLSKSAVSILNQSVQSDREGKFAGGTNEYFITYFIVFCVLMSVCLCVMFVRMELMSDKPNHKIALVVSVLLFLFLKISMVRFGVMPGAFPVLFASLVFYILTRKTNTDL